MIDAKQATPAAELERQICSATEPKNEREWWAHREIERLRDRLSVETLALVETLARAEKAEAERDGLRARIAALEDEKNAYIDYVGDALGQDHDSESLWDAAQRVLSDRDRIRVERDEVKALAVRWLRKWQTDMNPTPEMLEQTHALIGAALGER